MIDSTSMFPSMSTLMDALPSPSSGTSNISRVHSLRSMADSKEAESPPRKRRRVAESHWGPLPSHHVVRRKKALEDIIAHSGYTYSKDLKAHKSCVNALSLSHGDDGCGGPRFLASAGDDRRVLLWDTWSNLDEARPVAECSGAMSNIFSVAFSCDNRHIASCGNESTVLLHDIDRDLASIVSGSPGDTVAPSFRWYGNKAEIKRVATHPSNPNLFISAGGDGTVRQYDVRERTQVGQLEDVIDYTDCEYNPASTNLFATSNAVGDMLLHDIRKCFSSSHSLKPKKKAVVEYTTKLAKPRIAKIACPDVSSITFDPSGQIIAGTIMKYGPTIWQVGDCEPLAVLGAPGYKNACTMKHGSFRMSSVDGKLQYGSGSDDFKAYIWDIPPLEELKDRRRIVDFTDWWVHADKATIGFTNVRTGPRLVITPEDLGSPVRTLAGHRSIVNTLLFHPTLPYVFTCGIEKMVKVWSPSPISPSDADGNEVKKAEERKRNPMSRTEIYAQELLEDVDGGDGETVEEDERTLRLFDGLLQEEEDVGQGLFDDTEDDDDSDEDVDEDDGDDEDEGQDEGRARDELNEVEPDDQELEDAFAVHSGSPRAEDTC